MFDLRQGQPKQVVPFSRFLGSVNKSPGTAMWAAPRPEGMMSEEHPKGGRRHERYERLIALANGIAPAIPPAVARAEFLMKGGLHSDELPAEAVPFGIGSPSAQSTGVSAGHLRQPSSQLTFEEPQ
jgi:hypothetical protein